jgi:dTMP kinase
MLYSASRAQLVHEIIRPAMRQGRWVLADRYTDATLAYQGFGRGLEREVLQRILDWATGGLQPHLTVLLDCEVAIASSRMSGRKGQEDRIEQEDRSFHQRVREGYLELARSAPERFLVVDGNRRLEEVRANFRESFVAALKGSRTTPPGFE